MVRLRKHLFFILAILNCSMLFANPLQTELNYGWKFRQARLTNWYPATVPGVVHLDLLANKIIEDPFYRLNERGLQWIDKEDWIYETSFDVRDEMFVKNTIILDFKGLDNYADIYLNGEKIMSVNNMFREWKIDIKGKVKAKDNILHIYFHSPIKIDIPKFDALPFQYRTGPDQSENGGIFDKRVSIFARKAGYQYGWDWGPRFVTSGIWRPVFLKAWDNVCLENVYIQQKEVTSKKAVITTHVEILADKDIPGAKILVKNNVTGKVFGTATANLKSGLNNIPVNFTIDNPKLWWSNGLGEPHLYDFLTVVSVDSKVVDSQLNKIGIRSLKVINTTDKYGKQLYFELNGVRVFAKGANYIPNDNFLPRVTKEKYEQTILDAVNVNMNMLRVWGGGIYENDIFYDLCDKYGIMVWQDFMFACSLYPAEGAFLENIRQEAIENVKRLRNHPSLALFAGNNETHEFWISWGWKEFYRDQNPEYERIVWKQYNDLFEGVLPEVVKEYCPGTFYQSSSPYNTGTNDDKNGDRHYWGVWHGHQPTSEFNNIRSRFFSEYGFQSFPEFQSVRKFAPNAEDWNITSEVMMLHQRAGSYANPLIEEYLEKEYKKPKDFQSFIYMSQVLQGDAVKIAITAHRRDMPYCMGTLFWQHNDCWPVASWSSRDYYGRWKAQHYFAREAYRDMLVSPILNAENLDVYVISDRLKVLKGTLELKVMKLDGTIVSESKQTVTVPSNTSTKMTSVPTALLLKGTPKEEVLVYSKFTDTTGKSYDNTYYLVKQKDIDFPKVQIKSSIKAVQGGFQVSLTSDKFVRAAFMSVEGIDNFFENNYFDILPGQTVSTKVRTSLSQSVFEKQLKIVSISDAY